jgi:hypothetical protein
LIELSSTLREWSQALRADLRLLRGETRRLLDARQAIGRRLFK